MQRSLLLVILLLLSDLVPEACAIEVTASPAWHGVVRNSAVTEVAIRIRADQGGEVIATLSGALVTYHYHASVAPGQTLVWRPAVRVNDDTFQLSVQLNGEAAVNQSVAFQRQTSRSRVTVVITPDYSLNAASGKSFPGKLIRLPPAALPFQSSSYSTPDLVVMERDAITALSREQSLALQHHVERCGRIIIIGLSDSMLKSFSRLAGCQGKFITTASSFDAAGRTAAELIQHRPPVLPSAQSLSTLLGSDIADENDSFRVAFFLLYFTCLLLTLRSQSALPYQSAIYVVAMIVGIITWSMRDQQVEQVTWAEAYTGDATARVRTLSRVTGGGSMWATHTNTAGGIPSMPGQDQQVDIYHAGTELPRELRFKTRLSARHQLLSDGTVKPTHRLALSYIDGSAAVYNNGDTASPPATLALDGNRYSVPTIAPGHQWQPTGAAEPWKNNAAEKLFRQRAMPVPLALLVTQTSQEYKHPVNNYLMLRP